MTTPFGFTYDVAVKFATVAGVPNVLVSASGLRFVVLEQATDSPTQRIRPLTDVNGAALAGDVVVANSRSGIPQFNVPGDGRPSVWLQLISDNDDPVGAPSQILAADLPAQVAALRLAANSAATALQSSTLGQPNGPAVLGADGRLGFSQLPTNIGTGGTGGGTVAPATTTTQGTVRLAGALAGTADSPTVPGLASKADATDARLSDARNPKTGSVTTATVATGGLAPSVITGTAVVTTDSRLSDARAPLTHQHQASQITDFTAAVQAVAGSGGSGVDQTARDSAAFAQTTANTANTKATGAAADAAAAVPKTLGILVRTRTAANEASPTATNWSARLPGYGLVLAVGALPTPSDAAATDVHLIPQ